MTDSPMGSMTSTPGPAPAKMGLLARLIGAYTSPSRLFRYLVDQPHWIMILVVVGLAVGFINFALLSTEIGENIIREQIEEQTKNAPTPPSEELIQLQIKVSRFGSPLIWVVIVLVISLLVTTITYVIFNLFMGGEARFRQTLSICSHVYPVFILHSALTTLLIFVKGSTQATTSLAAFLPIFEIEPDSLLYRLFQGLDPFYMWEVGLLALGASILYRKPFGRCATVLYGVFLVFVIGIGTLVWKVSS